MAVAKVTIANPIVHGLAVSSTGDGVPVQYRTSHAATFDNPSGLLSLANLDGRFLAQEWKGDPLPVTAADNATVTGGLAGVYYGPLSGQRHGVYRVDFSYETTPTSGQFRIESPSGTTIFGPLYVGSAGPQHVAFEDGLKGAREGSLFVNLTSGGASVKGQVSVSQRRIE